MRNRNKQKKTKTVQQEQVACEHCARWDRNHIKNMPDGSRMAYCRVFSVTMNAEWHCSMAIRRDEG